MKKSRVFCLVTGAHVVAFGGLLLSQGCGTTRAPLPREDTFVMPPTQETDVVRPVPVEPVHRPAPMPPRVEPQPVVVTPPPTDTTTYTVVQGDNLSTIARRFGVSVAEIMMLNQISDPNRIRVGQQLKLPGNVDLAQPRTAAPRQETRPATATVPGERYVVQVGDSLSVIAQRYGTTQQALMRANNISNPDRIQVGQELVIPAGERRPATPAAPAPAARPTAAPPRAAAPVVAPAVVEKPAGEAPAAPTAARTAAGQTYTIQIGDDLLSVASEFNVSIAALRAANRLDSDILVPGRVLIIPDVD